MFAAELDIWLQTDGPNLVDEPGLHGDFDASLETQAGASSANF